MRVVITGGTGLIGQELTADLAKDGHEVIVVSRSPRQAGTLPGSVRFELWDARTAQGWGALVDGADAVVNLAGEPLAGTGFLPSRWTDERKRRIIDSRASAGQAVVEAIKAARKKPGVVIQASAVGYYGAQGDEDVTEDTPPATDFLGKGCVQWEISTQPVEEMGVRRAIMRTGILLSAKGGVLPRLALPFKLFAGGPLGSGRQQLPWIHMADEIAAIRFLMETSAASGAFNLSAPNPMNNREFSRTLGRVLNRPSYFPMPGFAFQIAFGEVSEVVLTGQRALPKRLLDLGFKFKFTDLEAALRDLYKK
jgi:uncharacterized protein (TIGR01777 family)